MEFDLHRRHLHCLQQSDSHRETRGSSSSSSSEEHDRVLTADHRGLSLGRTDGIPRSGDSAEEKLRWLRSQIIGTAVEVETPFGRRLLTYADHTASGRSLSYVEDYIAANVLPYYGNCHTSDSFTGYQSTRMVHQASNYVKKCLGGGEDDAIIFCGSGSTAAIKRLQEVMGLAIPSILRQRLLNCLSEKERWVVFVGPYEHHSNVLSWRQSLAEVVEIGLNRHGLFDMHALREKLEFYKATNRPILGSFSACSNVTGLRSDAPAIARLLHQFGGFACFDFAASGPYEKIEMKSGERDGYDAIFLSPHKFLGGPGTPGVLVMSKALYRLGAAPPSTCGGGTVDFVNGINEEDTLYVESIEEREDAGTPQIIQRIRAALVFWIKELIGCETIARLEKRYIETALARLVPNPHIWVLGNTTARRQAILSFLVHSTSSSHNINGLDLWKETGDVQDKPLHGPFVAKLLNDLFGIQARGGCACAGPYGHSLLGVNKPQSLAFRSAIKKGYVGIKPGWTRVSFPYYISQEEFEFILTAIEFIVIYGQRFLPLYHFSWRKGTWTFKKNTIQQNYSTSLPTMIKALNLGENENQATRHERVLDSYKSYLENAKSIATLLPKFPPQRRIPEDIDINLVPFRV